MDDVIAWARTLLFMAVFYTGSVLIVLTVPISALIGPRALAAHAHGWARLHRWAARHLLGITVRVEGAPLAEPALYASKHQSMFETTELALLLQGPAVVLKRELARIPLWGWAARRYGAIVVDREASAKALRGMMREAQAARASGRSVVIYPEGTRVAPGERAAAQAGVRRAVSRAGAADGAGRGRHGALMASVRAKAGGGGDAAFW